MNRNIVALVSGLLFGLGLGLGGMLQPDKIIGFLDFAGHWDPTLNFVMIGAVAVYFVAHRVAKRLGSPILGGAFQIPTRRDIDARLVLGAVIFGAGWGLGGFCPGPAWVAGAALNGAAWVFLAAMLMGMMVFGVLDAIWARRRTPSVVDDEGNASEVASSLRPAA